MRRAFSAKSPIWSIIIALGALTLLALTFIKHRLDFLNVAQPVLLVACAALLYFKSRTP
jgi:hypothetical protein